jgi:hypothetical protein
LGYVTEKTYDGLGHLTTLIRYENSAGQRLTGLWTTAELDTHAATAMCEAVEGLGGVSDGQSHRKIRQILRW